MQDDAVFASLAPIADLPTDVHHPPLDHVVAPGTELSTGADRPVVHTNSRTGGAVIVRWAKKAARRGPLFAVQTPHDPPPLSADDAQRTARMASLLATARPLVGHGDVAATRAQLARVNEEEWRVPRSRLAPLSGIFSAADWPAVLKRANTVWGKKHVETTCATFWTRIGLGAADHLADNGAASMLLLDFMQELAKEVFAACEDVPVALHVADAAMLAFFGALPPGDGMCVWPEGLSFEDARERLRVAPPVGTGTIYPLPVPPASLVRHLHATPPVLSAYIRAFLRLGSPGGEEEENFAAHAALATEALLATLPALMLREREREREEGGGEEGQTVQLLAELWNEESPLAHATAKTGDASPVPPCAVLGRETPGVRALAVGEFLPKTLCGAKFALLARALAVAVAVVVGRRREEEEVVSGTVEQHNLLLQCMFGDGMRQRKREVVLPALASAATTPVRGKGMGKRKFESEGEV